MKAKELAEILLQNPEAEVVHYQYTGGDTPLLIVNTAHTELKGEVSSSYDGGHFVDKLGIVESDLIILGYDPNL